ncbi:septum formation family protein [Pseudarthrobacter sulfonivorans]|uniref:septum formation family protein n=1 Tax=Pseudarthrobacter sulfonivorans TaxID=121292 RepID=UPI002105F57A|nr:septum formation family protein [Pseudarthrobacter sulfonivorans]
MDNQEQRPLPPRPSAPPTVGFPQVTAAPAAPPEGPEPSPATPRRAVSWLLKAVFALVLIAVVVALVWLANQLGSQPAAPPGDPGSVTIETSPTPLPTPLPLPREGVTPPDYRLGDCFKDFDPAALRSTVVACDTGHSAQLVAVFRYPGKDSYPGREALAAKALEACRAATLNSASNNYTLNFQRAYPSGTSWDSGDRRVDCYVTADAGNVINASVLP